MSGPSLEGRTFGPGRPCVVAEVSCNHALNYKLGLALIRAAKDAGADAVKYQAYGPDDLTLRSDHPAYRIDSGPWAGQSYHELYTQAQTPLEWLPGWFRAARQIGLIPFASVFSFRVIEELEKLDCPAYKIASFEVPWLDLVRAAAATGKPVIASDGVATAWDLARAAAVVGPERYLLLRCVSEYPAGANAYRFGDLQDGPHPWGVSDHSCEPCVPATAVAMGASLVEAHLMLEPEAYDAPPLDVNHSYTPSAFAEMVRAVRTAAAARGSGSKDVPGSRRLVWATSLSAGTHTGESSPTLVVRAKWGAPPDFDVRGMRLTRDVVAGEPVTLDQLEKAS